VSVFRFIAAEKANHPVSLLCEVLGVSRSGFHAWQRRPPSPRARRDAWLLELIEPIHRDSHRTYGAPRVHAELRLEHDVRVGRKRVERLMRQAGLSGVVRRRRGKTTIAAPGIRTAPDLVVRDFNPTRPNRLWCADITYVRTWEGWLYLASVMDCCSRRIVGWALADHLRAELVDDALQMAVARRRPTRASCTTPIAAASTRRWSSRAAAAPSESRSRWAPRAAASTTPCSRASTRRSTKDLIHRRSWPTKPEARIAVFEYIEAFYNRRRRHSTLGYLSPADYENSTRMTGGAGLAASRLALTEKITRSTSAAQAA
jgi:putative transposase